MSKLFEFSTGQSLNQVFRHTSYRHDVRQVDPWSGNIRELEHAIEKAVIICDGAFLSAGLFQLQRRNEAPEMPAASTLEDMEKQMIRRTLDKCGGNLSAVASQLGITRQTLYNKMKKYGL